jgi:hypothetical protein
VHGTFKWWAEHWKAIVNDKVSKGQHPYKLNDDGPLFLLYMNIVNNPDLTWSGIEDDDSERGNDDG